LYVFLRTATPTEVATAGIVVVKSISLTSTRGLR